MSASDWGRWLLDEVAATDPSGVDLWYLGCNGFIIKGSDGTTLMIDPYLGTGDPPRTIRMIPVPFDPAGVEALDAMLLTHEHTDHTHGPSQAPILESTGARCYAPPAAYEKATESEAWPRRFDVDDDQIVKVQPGAELEIGAFTITVIETYDPDAVDPVGFVIEHPSGTIVHLGDARPSDGLEDVGDAYEIDIAIAAYGTAGMIPDKETGELVHTQWYSDADDIITIAQQLACDRLVPTHWDMWKGLTADPRGLIDHARSFPYPQHVEVLEIGDSTGV
jgi:L-ascorbate 6-phosphate lactonase